MFPDPKKMFDSTHEENQRKYGEGARDARKAGVVKRFLKELEDTVGKFFPDNRKSSDKSYDAGWRDNVYQEPERKNEKNNERNKRNKSHSNNYYSHSSGTSNSHLPSILGCSFVTILVFGIITVILTVILTVIFGIGLLFWGIYSWADRIVDEA